MGGLRPAPPGQVSGVTNTTALHPPGSVSGWVPRGGTEGAGGHCLLHRCRRGAWPLEEHGKALGHDGVRRKKPVGSRVGERNSCRGREQKLRLFSSPAPCHSPTPATAAAPRRPPAQPGDNPAGGERCPTADSIPRATETHAALSRPHAGGHHQS